MRGIISDRESRDVERPRRTGRTVAVRQLTDRRAKDMSPDAPNSTARLGMTTGHGRPQQDQEALPYNFPPPPPAGPCCHPERLRWSEAGAGYARDHATGNHALPEKQAACPVTTVTLRSKHAPLCVGVTNDLTRRVSEHKQHLVPGFTAAMTAPTSLLPTFGDVARAIARGAGRSHGRERWRCSPQQPAVAGDWPRTGTGRRRGWSRARPSGIPCRI